MRYYITEKNLCTTDIDFHLDGLSKDEKMDYFRQATIYRLLLIEYINLLGVQQYDQILQKNENYFRAIPLFKQDFYQYYSFIGNKYYYLRNNIYLERLTEEERNYLNSRAKNNMFQIEQRDMKFIASTFQKVIREERRGIKGTFETNFGPPSPQYFALNHSLVIGVRYDWSDELHYQQKKFCHDINQKLENELKEKLNIPVKVIIYSDFSTKKLPNRRDI